MVDTNGGEDRLAPVIPLFDGKMVPASALPDRSHSTPSAPRSADAERPAHVDSSVSAEPGEPEEDSVRLAAEEVLVRKLRARSLSVSEARQILRGQGLGAGQVDDVIDAFCRRGYLDDVSLAEQLVHSGVERKGQGRVALSRSLAQRGVSREAIDTALGELPDDDAERALEFARTKARSMSRLDFDTALRRMVGQLARRGYGGSIAMTAARTALTETATGSPSSGVRFVDSE